MNSKYKGKLRRRSNILITQEGYYTLKQTSFGYAATEVTNYYNQEVFKRPPKEYGDTLLISNYGRVFLVKSQKYAKINIEQYGGYYYFTHTFPNKKRTIVRLHKILIDTFKPKPADKVDWVSSFKDGDCKNIDLSNLQWVERYKYDSLKAKRKRFKAHDIIIKNTLTGEEFKTATIKHAAELTRKHYSRLIRNFQKNLEIQIDEFILIRNIT